MNLALDAVPKNIDIDEVHKYLLSKEGVIDVHDLHIWAVSTTQIALTVHLVMPQGNTDKFIADLQQELHSKFGIGHSTFQIENNKPDNESDPEC